MISIIVMKVMMVSNVVMRVIVRLLLELGLFWLFSIGISIRVSIMVRFFIIS